MSIVTTTKGDMDTDLLEKKEGGFEDDNEINHPKRFDKREPNRQRKGGPDKKTGDHF